MIFDTIETATEALTKLWNADLDYNDEIFLIPSKEHNGKIQLFFRCDDTFAWGMSDLEPAMTVEAIDRYIELEKLVADNYELLNTVPEWFRGYSRNIPLRVASDLWACERRGMRPQPPIQQMYAFQKLCELAGVDIKKFANNPFEKSGNE